MVAAYAGHTEVVVELVKSGANLNLQDYVCLDTNSNCILQYWMKTVSVYNVLMGYEFSMPLQGCQKQITVEAEHICM